MSDNNKRFEKIEPDEKMLDLLYKVLQQNEQILEQNKKIVESVVSPKIVYSPHNNQDD